MKNVLSLSQFNRKFHSEKACSRFLAKARWKGKVTCPHCDHKKVWRIKGYMGFKCAGCKRVFSVRTGTIMERSNISLYNWLLAMHLIVTDKAGITSVELGSRLGISQGMAWFLAARIREMFAEEGIMLSGVVEADETYIGGKYKNMSYERKKKCPGRGIVGKFPVFGAIERGGKVYANHIDNTSKEIIHRSIHNHVEKGSTLYTDEHRSYLGLDEDYNHHVVKHSAWQFVDGEVNTNSIESFWSMVKWNYSTHRWMSLKHLQGYIDEIVFRHNYKEMSELEMIATLIKNSEGRQLTYLKLIEN